MLLRFAAVAESKVHINLSFAPVVKTVEPAIVSIYAAQVVERSLNPLFDDDFFAQFFRPPPFPRQELAKSMGSVVLIDDKGAIVTCAHVVRNAQEINVKLSDNREFKAKVNVMDTQNDIAILSLEKVSEKIPFVPLVDHDDSESGDLVLAFGNPFGIGHTVTSGILSAKTRNVGGRVLLQTDAPINPEILGGALVNMKGELIGIPNAILSKWVQKLLGLVLGIPISTIKPLLGLSAKDGNICVVDWV